MGRAVWALLLAVTVWGAPKRILFVTHSAGFVHGSIGTARRVVEDIGRRTEAFDTVATEDLSYLSADRLRDFDAVFFFTSGELPLSDDQKRDLLDYVRSGRGFGGAHSATDTLYQWPEYGELIGAYFDGHPWTQVAGIDIEDPDHPATRGLGNGFRILEEFYQFRSFSRDRVRVLATLDTRSVNLGADGVHRADEDFALAWCRPYGEGRVFYTALGHFDETWLDARFQKILEGALRWMIRDADGAAAPRRPTPVITRVASAANEPADAVAPGQMLVITGTGLTPGGSMTADSGFPLKLAGAEARLNGSAIPLVSAGPELLQAVLPMDIEDGAMLTIVHPGGNASMPQRLTVTRAVPVIRGVERTGSMIRLSIAGMGRETEVQVLVNGTAALVENLSPPRWFVDLWQVDATLPGGLTGRLEVKVIVAGRESNTVEVPPGA